MKNLIVYHPRVVNAIIGGFNLKRILISKMQQGLNNNGCQGNIMQIKLIIRPKNGGF